jgi:hypothetical protein
VLEIGKTLRERFIRDPEKKREAEMEMFRMAADGELKQVIAQLEINAREAQHPSLFVAGGRPFFLWIGGRRVPLCRPAAADAYLAGAHRGVAGATHNGC